MKPLLPFYLQPIGLIATAAALATFMLIAKPPHAWLCYLLWLLWVCVLEQRRLPSPLGRTVCVGLGALLVMVILSLWQPSLPLSWFFIALPLFIWVFHYRQHQHRLLTVKPLPLNTDTPLPLRLEQELRYPWGSLLYSVSAVILLTEALLALSSLMRKFTFSSLLLALLLCGLAYLAWKAREYFWKRYQFFAQYGGEWLQINERGLSWRKFNSTAHDLLPTNTNYVHIHIAWEHISQLEILTDSNAGKYLRIHSQKALNFGLNPHCMDIYEQEVAYPLQTLEAYLQQFRQQTNSY